MGNFKKHLQLAKEKLKVVVNSYKNKQYTVVEDLATKIVEQLIEADADKIGEHFGDHQSRHNYSNKNFPEDINRSMRKIWFAYGDLGYDGVNGRKAKQVMDNLKIVLKFFEKKFGEKIYEEDI